MHNRLQRIKKSAEEKIKAASNAETLKKIKVEYLGRKGQITAVLRSLKDLIPEERSAVGRQQTSLRTTWKN